MNFKMDKKFQDYFNNVKQVFLYVIDDCNLQCVQCLYKADTTFYLRKKKIELDSCIKLIEDFREMGAVKLTIMGGEPTLYGQEKEWAPLLKLIKRSKELGYEYVRIDTNGQFENRLLEKEEFMLLDEITFSLDGPTKEINDPVRGEGSFEKCVSTIKRAIELGYNINITSCIHKGMVEKDEDGNYNLHKMIKFAEEIGVSRINFHDLFKSGIPRDVWTGNIDISLDEWFSVWSDIQRKVEKGEYSIPVRIPQSFTSKEDFDKDPQYYGYCSAKLGERILVHPNGILRICSLMIGTPYGVAKYYDDKIVWDEGYTNELGDHILDKHTPCTNQSKSNKFGGFCPLCVSFKPKQNEFIWEQKLRWENNKKECGLEN